MKKNIILVAVIVSVITTSCRKDRTCTCSSTLTETRTQAGTTVTTVGTENSVTIYKKITKKLAKTANCYDRTETYTYSGGGSGNNAYTVSDVTVYSCKLK